MNTSDYISKLIREDRDRRERLVLVEGEENGLSSRSVRDIIAETKSTIRNGKV